MRVGVEVGGTFTDLVAFHGDTVTITKVPSTPHAPEQGAFNAVLESGLPIGEIEDFAHGSTVATNAILERKGERVAFVTTAGFRDLLQLQRQDRRNIYNLRYQNPVSVVPRESCFEVAERMLSDGTVALALDEHAVRSTLVPQLRGGGYRAIAICLLNAFANPAHEQRVAGLLQAELPDVTVTISTDVVNEFREYERANTTALSAYVQPVIAGYLTRFSTWLAEQSFTGHFTVMQSNGGRLPAEAMGRNAISALFSGPAAGVVGAARQAARSNYGKLITFDMGGTSTDVSLIEDGEFRMSTETIIDGLPVRTPVLDIATVGAGGGSLVWIDEGGMLRVGPQSAGASPGPACYGKGGTRPTVTDAHIVCGTIRADIMLGNHIRIDRDAARRAFQPVADELGVTIEAAAESAIQLANANIVRAIQLVSTERGRDPRDYAVVPFGGAGPLHAASVAKDLGVETVVIPPNAGVISAYGLLASDYVKFQSRTHKVRLTDEAMAPLAADVAQLRESLASQFAEIGLTGPLQWKLGIDMRFVGQAFEVSVELDVEQIGTLDADRLRARFLDAHERIYFHGVGSKRAIEIISLRLAARKPLAHLPRLVRQKEAAHDLPDTPLFLDGEWHDCRRVAEGSLAAGDEVNGPAVIEGMTSTVLIPPGWTSRFDAEDNLILTRTGS